MFAASGDSNIERGLFVFLFKRLNRSLTRREIDKRRGQIENGIRFESTGNIDCQDADQRQEQALLVDLSAFVNLDGVNMPAWTQAFAILFDTDFDDLVVLERDSDASRSINDRPCRHRPGPFEIRSSCPVRRRPDDAVWSSVRGKISFDRACQRWS